MPKKEDILAASARTIAERGVRGLRVSDIADAAGVSPGLLYYHFTDRDGLLEAALEHINTVARTFRTENSTAGDSARERLTKQVLDEIQDDEQVRLNSVAWNELRACAVFEANLRAPIRASSEEWSDEIASVIAEAQDAGEITPELPALDTARALTALVEGISGRWLSGELTTAAARQSLTDTLHYLIDRAPITERNPA